MSVVLYCCTDLIFATKIRSTADAVGVSSGAVSDPTGLAEQIEDLTEPATGLMVDLELGDKALSLIDEARQRLPQAKIIAFGSHVAKETLEAAKEHGAHQVLPRSAFTEQLPDLLREHKTT
jgi:DNA-binding NarL/FixJ family response regulator